jgi:hypothetical protein
MVAAMKANMTSGERTDLQRTRGRLSVKEAADEVGVGTTVVSQSKRILRKGTQEIIDAVKNGKLSTRPIGNIAAI